MKYVVIVGDGMADYALPELDGQTPLQVARTPNMDFLARNGVLGLVRTIPEGMPAGSEVANLSILGYEPRKYYTGRGALEAAGVGVLLNPEDVAFRANLVATDGEKLIDYSAGHITDEEAKVLVGLISEKLGSGKINFYPGVSYRFIMVWRGGSGDVWCAAPHEIQGQGIKENLPQGDGENILRGLIYDSFEILDNHEINRRRRDEGKLPGNMIWFWGVGRVPKLPSFTLKYGLTGAVISGVNLIKGIGYYAGLKVVEVPGATGYIDTNYLGKALYALDCLKDMDFVYIHIEAPDEASHIADVAAKIKAIEEIDEKVVGELLKRLGQFEPCKILLMTDHPTPIPVKVHTSEPVPFCIYSSGGESNKAGYFDELSAKEEGLLQLEEGHKLMDIFIGVGE